MLCITSKVDTYNIKIDTLVVVAVKRENDTCFGNGLVMGSADCLYYAGLVKTPEKLFKLKLGPLPDRLEAGACVFPPFQISRGQNA